MANKTLHCDELPEDGNITEVVDIAVSMEELEEAVIQYLVNNYNLNRDDLECCHQMVTIDACTVTIGDTSHCVDVEDSTQTAAVVIKNFNRKMYAGG